MLEKNTSFFQFLHVWKDGVPPQVCFNPDPRKGMTTQCPIHRLTPLVTAVLLAILMLIQGPLVGAQETELKVCEKKGGWKELSGKVPFHDMVNDHRIWLKNPTDFPPWDFSGINFQEDFLDGLDLRNASFVYADLRYAQLNESTLDNAIFKLACLKLAYLQGTSLIHADLTQVDLTEAELSGAILIHANLTGANLTKANLGPREQDQNTEFSKLEIPENPSDWYKNKSSCVLNYKDIKSSMDASKDQFGRTDLRCANLSGAILIGVNLSQADLRGATLKGANLSQANLTRADLRGADLKGAILREAVLKNATVASADFEDANLFDADMSGVDLTNVSFDLMSKKEKGPDGIPDVRKLNAVDNHLERLTFENTPSSLKELERKFDAAGMINEKQAVIAARETTLTRKLLGSTFLLDRLHGKLREIFFEITSEYGWSRKTILEIVFLIWLSSSIIYAFFIAFNRKGQWGIRATWLEDTATLAVADEKDLPGNSLPQKMVPASPDCFWPYFKSSYNGQKLQQNFVSDFLASLVGGMYASTLFSFMAIQIFPFGLSSLDLSKWIATTLNPRECEIHAAGWIKLAAAVQSTMTLYLLGLLLWLTWGHPFG